MTKFAFKTLTIAGTSVEVPEITRFNEPSKANFYRTVSPENPPKVIGYFIPNETN
jgi:hypothetical protein